MGALVGLGVWAGTGGFVGPAFGLGAGGVVLTVGAGNGGAVTGGVVAVIIVGLTTGLEAVGLGAGGAEVGAGTCGTTGVIIVGLTTGLATVGRGVLAGRTLFDSLSRRRSK